MMEGPLDQTCALQVAQNGYAIFPDIVSAAEIQQLASKLERSALRHGRAGVRHLLGNSAVAALANASSKSQSDLPRQVIHIEYASLGAVNAPLRLARA